MFPLSASHPSMSSRPELFLFIQAGFVRELDPDAEKKDKNGTRTKDGGKTELHKRGKNKRQVEIHTGETHRKQDKDTELQNKTGSKGTRDTNCVKFAHQCGFEPNAHN